MEIRRRKAEAECVENAQGCSGKDGGIGRVEQGFAEARVPVRGIDDLLCADARDGDGERPSGFLLQASATREIGSFTLPEEDSKDQTQLTSVLEKSFPLASRDSPDVLANA